MPQMEPMQWTLLHFFMMIILFSFLMLIYFNIYYKLNNLFLNKNYNMIFIKCLKSKCYIYDLYKKDFGCDLLLKW